MKREDALPCGAKDERTDEERAREVFSRHLENGDAMIFLVPANLVADPEEKGVGLANFRQHQNCGFGCTKTVSRTRGDKRQVLVYNERAPEREQDLVFYGVSAARKFGQEEVFFVGSNGFGYMISCVEENGRHIGEEFLSNGIGSVLEPAKISSDDVLRHISSLVGERFAIASDSRSRCFTADEYRKDRKRAMIRKYGYDCLDCICPSVFTYWQDYPEETARDRIESRLMRHTTMAVLIPRNVIHDEDRSKDRFEDFTLSASFGYDNVFCVGDENKKAMIVFKPADWSDDALFLYYTVSAARLFRQANMLYVDPWGYCRRVVCEEGEGKKIGDMVPAFTDINGAAKRVSADEFVTLLEEIVGGEVRMSESEIRHFNGVSGMAVGSMLDGIKKLGYKCLFYAKKPIVSSDES